MSENEIRVPQPVPAAQPATVRRGIRVVELGRQPQTVRIEDGEVLTIRDLVSRGFLSSDPNYQYFINSRPANSDSLVQDGDAVVAVRKIVAG